MGLHSDEEVRGNAAWTNSKKALQTSSDPVSQSLPKSAKVCPCLPQLAIMHHLSIASPRKYRSYSNCEYRHSSTNSLLHQHQLLSLSSQTDIADFASYVRNKFLHCSFNPCVAQCLPETSNAGLKPLKLSRMLGPHLIDLLLWNLNMQKSEGTHSSLPLRCHTKSMDKWHCHLWI